MVKTRSSQASVDASFAVPMRGHKRRRSSTEPPSGTSSVTPAPKTRKTRASGRLFLSPDDQLHEEDRAASEEPGISEEGDVSDDHLASSEVAAPPDSSPQPSDDTSGTQISIEIPIPTRSRPAEARQSASAKLPVPASVRVEPLKEAIARGRKRASERFDLAPKSSPHSEEEASIFIDPQDLDIESKHTPTPSSSFKFSFATQTPNAFSQSTFTRFLPPGSTQREEDIRKYERTIKSMNDERAELVAQLQTLLLGLRSLGFAEGQDVQDICATIRTAFDEARNNLSDLLEQPSIADLSNQDFLISLTDTVHSLVKNNSDGSEQLEKADEMILFIRAEYDGVLAKLVEAAIREEGLTQILQLERAAKEQLLKEVSELTGEVKRRHEEIADLKNVSDDRVRQIGTLRADCTEFREKVEALETEIIRLQGLSAEALAGMNRDYAERVENMVDELNQENDYRAIAEEIISEKDGEITTLQIKYQEARTELESTKDDLSALRKGINAYEETMQALKEDIVSKDVEIQEADTALEKQGREIVALTDGVKNLSEFREADAAKLRNLGLDLEEAHKREEELNKHLNTASEEINKLRSELFGISEARNQLSKQLAERDADLIAKTNECNSLTSQAKKQKILIERLEEDVANLNTAMEQLSEEKDRVIDGKNELLDMRNVELDKQRELYKTDIDGKNEFIRILEREIDSNDVKIHNVEVVNKKLEEKVKKLDLENNTKADHVDKLQNNLTVAKRQANKFKSDVAVLDADVKALKKEVYERTVERDTVQKDLAGRDKEVSTLRMLNTKLIGEINEDALKAGIWSAQKLAVVAEASSQNDVSVPIQNGVTTQTKVQTTVHKKLQVRDSGFVDQENQGTLMEE